MSLARGSSLLTKHARDVVLVSALRTPITRAKKGGLAGMSPEELLTQILSRTLSHSRIDPAVVEDVAVGTVLQALGGHKVSAMAVKHAGFPWSTTTQTINRQCASSAQAVAHVAANIQAGQISCGLAAGVESMTMDYFDTRGIPSRVAEGLKGSRLQEAKDVLMPMGRTSENVAEKYAISRADQDAFALQSHVRASTAQRNGWFTEVVPVSAPSLDGAEVQVDRDDGVRGNLTLEKLASLPPAFGEGGATTAGNASQISDGASAVLLMTREKAEKVGCKPLGKFVQSAVAGVPAHLMGIGPISAVQKVLGKVGLRTEDVDVWELNEAFASQSLHVIRELKLDMHRVNVHGGAIALGHPLGATGARCIATLFAAMERLDKHVGVVSMCASTGQGWAGLFIREQ